MGVPRTVAVLAGVAWVVGVTLVGTQADTDPVGAWYDAANRALAPALLLLVVLAVLLRRAATGSTRTGVTLLGTAAALFLAGNLVEFWLVLGSDLHTQKTAARLAEQQSFAGSDLGWFCFLAGLLVAFVAVAWLGRAAGGRRGLAMALLGVAGLMSTALWAVSPLAAAAAGACFAVWLLTVAQLVEDGSSAYAVPAT